MEKREDTKSAAGAVPAGGAWKGEKMKRRFLLGLGAGFLLFLGNAQGEGFDTFRGIKWGEDQKSISGLLPGPRNENVEVFTRDEPKTVGDIGVESIYYFFYKGRFGAARITFQGPQNASFLRDALYKKYGTSKDQDPSAEKIVWEMVDLKVRYQYADIDKEGRVDYFFKPVVQQREEDKAKAQRQEALKRIDDL